MALRWRVNSLSEVRPHLRGEYAVQEDGTWKLQLDDLEDEVRGLVSALKTERALRKQAEKRFSEVRAKLAEGRRREANASDAKEATI